VGAVDHGPSHCVRSAKDGRGRCGDAACRWPSRAAACRG
jgi:hypothetical protein